MDRFLSLKGFLKMELVSRLFIVCRYMVLFFILFCSSSRRDSKRGGERGRRRKREKENKLYMKIENKWME